MKKSTMLDLWLLVSYIPLVNGAGSCSYFKDCITCSHINSWLPFTKCRWCPLDLECHAFGSPHNPCTTLQDIKEPSLCYDVEDGEYKPDAAYASLLLSSAAYSEDPETCLKTIYPESGVVVHKMALSNCVNLPLFKYKECFAYIGISNVMKTVIIAFRGTANTTQFVDEAVSIVFKHKKQFIGNSYVQQYFLSAFEKFTPCLQTVLKELLLDNPEYQQYDVVVTGHSLGGALASLQAITLSEKQIVPKNKLFLYTFGEPRVGDQNYATEFDQRVNNSFRVVHFNDIVPYLPSKLPNALPGPYHHRREVYYNMKEMYANNEFTLAATNEDSNLRNSLGLACPLDDMGDCVNSHLFYFGIPVGSYCGGTSRKKRSTDQGHSKMWHFLDGRNCTVIDPKDYRNYLYPSTANKVTIFFTTYILLLCFCQMV